MAKAITLKQPWAELVVIGAKQFETRSWPTKYRGEVYIHSSAKFNTNDLLLAIHSDTFRKAIPDPHSLQLGKIIGKAYIQDCLRVEDVRDALNGTAELVFGDYSNGRYAWSLSHAEKFKKPIPCKGSLGLWNFDHQIIYEYDY